MGSGQSKQENDIGSYVTEAVESAEASEYSRKLSRSTKRGCVSRAQSGYSPGGSAPFGYRRIAVNPLTGVILRELPEGVHRRKGEELVCLRPDEIEANVVRRIFDMKASGLGFKSIASSLNEEGLSCPKKGRWRNKDQKWSTGTISSIIQNPVYKGARVYNRFPKNKLSGRPRGRRNEMQDWIVKDDAHEPIVSKELFEKANSVRLFKYAGGAAQIVKSQYLLSGLIRCSHCGFNYSGLTRNKKNHRYYVDSGYQSKGPSVCKWHAIPKEKLEQFVVNTINDRIVDSVIPSQLEKLIEDYLSNNSGNDSYQEDRFEKLLRQNDMKMKHLLDAVENGIGVETILPRIKELEQEKERLNQEFENKKRVVVCKREAKTAAEEVAKFFLNFQGTFAHASVLEKKLLIRQVVLRMVVDRGKDVIQCVMTKLPKLQHSLIDSFRDRVLANQSNVCPERE